MVSMFCFKARAGIDPAGILYAGLGGAHAAPLDVLPLPYVAPGILDRQRPAGAYIYHVYILFYHKRLKKQ